ncbi:MAG: hypothetical protein J0M34_02000 [Alphaproteobacteria bacterium]|nr:hypothetical protein [Alphaproteobacteria bacterium]
MKKLLAASCLVVVAACTPPEQTYCDGFGLRQGEPEHQKCMTYYFQQEAAFNADRQGCEFEADKTYPPTLYDEGRWERVHGGLGYGPYGPAFGGGFGTSVYVEPDYYKNREVDRLRMRIIQPCMESKGWKSGETWQAGRLPRGAKKMPMPAPQQSSKLPWLK